MLRWSPKRDDHGQWCWHGLGWWLPARSSLTPGRDRELGNALFPGSPGTSSGSLAFVRGRRRRELRWGGASVRRAGGGLTPVQPWGENSPGNHLKRNRRASRRSSGPEDMKNTIWQSLGQAPCIPTGLAWEQQCPRGRWPAGSQKRGHSAHPRRSRSGALMGQAPRPLAAFPGP